LSPVTTIAIDTLTALAIATAIDVANTSFHQLHRAGTAKRDRP